jgi:hypothetical protein
MTSTPPGREQRVAALWAAIDDHDPSDFRAAMRALTDDLPAGHPLALLDEATAGLGDAVDAFLALVDIGPERDAASLALGALARHLPR